MASKKSIQRTSAIIDTYTSGRGFGIEVNRDVAGYMVYETNGDKVLRVMEYGLSAKELQFFLDGMLVTLEWSKQ